MFAWMRQQWRTHIRTMIASSYDIPLINKKILCAVIITFSIELIIIQMLIYIY